MHKLHVKAQTLLFSIIGLLCASTSHAQSPPSVTAREIQATPGPIVLSIELTTADEKAANCALEVPRPENTSLQVSTTSSSAGSTARTRIIVKRELGSVGKDIDDFVAAYASCQPAGSSSRFAWSLTKRAADK